jgi:glycosyltransferase involved in cell wall biosynthesis
VKILLVNWQDRLNPSAGGAEIHLHEIFGRLAARGHEVTLLTSGWRGTRSREQVDGITVHRVGGRFTFGAVAPRAGRRLLARERPHVVVEALNKVPVFSPAWSDRPTVLLVHHLFGTSAFQEAGVPVAAATWLLERPLPRVYARVPVQAISHSTADDLVVRGLSRENVRVIHPGVDVDYYIPAPEPHRAVAPTFLYLGRLKRYKRVDLILRALALLRERGTPAFLTIAGRGEWEPKLRQLATRLGLEDRVEFTGFVDERRKRELMRTAWANVFVSPKEGWGITNLEAAACGTPTIASNSPGLRESVVHRRTGELVPHGDVDALAGAMKKLADDPAYVSRLGQAAHAFAQQFTWDRAAGETEAHLDYVVGGEERSRSFPETMSHTEIR